MWDDYEWREGKDLEGDGHWILKSTTEEHQWSAERSNENISQKGQSSGQDGIIRIRNSGAGYTDMNGNLHFYWLLHLVIKACMVLHLWLN